jgi:4-amino-4-deoxychorismate lyase
LSTRRLVQPKTLIDGKPGDTLPVTDRGLLYGDGLFETLAVIDGRPCLWHRHLARLRDGCERLGIAVPDAATLRREAWSLTAQSPRAVLKIIITRGSGGRGYRPPEAAQPRRVLMLSDWPDWPAAWAEQGVRVRLCDARVADSPMVAGLKHLGRLEQVLARAEWRDPAIAEGLMLDGRGHLIEATQSNLFLERAGQLITPELSRAGVAGVLRGLILDLAAAAGSPVLERRVVPEDLPQADALYLSNSLIGVWRVAALADHSYPLQHAAHPVMRLAVEQAYGP